MKVFNVYKEVFTYFPDMHPPSMQLYTTSIIRLMDSNTYTHTAPAPSSNAPATPHASA